MVDVFPSFFLSCTAAVSLFLSFLPLNSFLSHFFPATLRPRDSVLIPWLYFLFLLYGLSLCFGLCLFLTCSTRFIQIQQHMHDLSLVSIYDFLLLFMLLAMKPPVSHYYKGDK